jgi:hypothetical protein
MLIYSWNAAICALVAFPDATIFIRLLSEGSSFAIYCSLRIVSWLLAWSSCLCGVATAGRELVAGLLLKGRVAVLALVDAADVVTGVVVDTPEETTPVSIRIGVVVVLDVGLNADWPVVDVPVEVLPFVVVDGPVAVAVPVVVLAPPLCPPDVALLLVGLVELVLVLLAEAVVLIGATVAVVEVVVSPVLSVPASPAAGNAFTGPDSVTDSLEATSDPTAGFLSPLTDFSDDSWFGATLDAGSVDSSFFPLSSAGVASTAVSCFGKLGVVVVVEGVSATAGCVFGALGVAIVTEAVSGVLVEALAPVVELANGIGGVPNGRTGVLMGAGAGDTGTL